MTTEFEVDGIVEQPEELAPAQVRKTTDGKLALRALVSRALR